MVLINSLRARKQGPYRGYDVVVVVVGVRICCYDVYTITIMPIIITFHGT